MFGARAIPALSLLLMLLSACSTIPFEKAEQPPLVFSGRHLAPDAAPRPAPRILAHAVQAAKAVTPEAAPATAPATTPVVINSQFSVRDILISVPRTLIVSETNSYLPRGDIVWRGEPEGDRYRQVWDILAEGMKAGTRDLTGPREVDVKLSLRRFHALTQKARMTTGGVHAIAFELTLIDTATGKPAAGPHRMQVDIEAFGGVRAAEAEARGDTQKTRIIRYLAKAIRMELTDPEGYRQPALGVVQVLNYL